MTTRHSLRLLLLASLLSVAFHVRGEPGATSAPAAQMRPVTALIGPPSQPVFDVRRYGAKGDGKTYDTAAIQKAIDACAGSGGSVCLFNGRFLTAQLRLRGGMTFYIDKTATLLGGTAPEDYPVLSPEDPQRLTGGRFYTRSVLYADQADNLVLDGDGTLDGQGRDVRMNGSEPERPSLLRIFRSTNLIVRNLTLKNPRMWTQVYDNCRLLTIENVKVHAPPTCKNLDGMDVCDSRDVIIRNNTVYSEDDAICLKSHGPAGLQNVLIENNTILCYRANGIKIGTYTKGPIENIRILNNTVLFAKYGGLCIESIDGAAMRNVVVRNLDLYRTCQPIFIRLGNGREKARKPGSISDVLIENVRALGTIEDTMPSCTITAFPGGRLENVRLRNITIEMPGGIMEIPDRPRDERDRIYPQSNIFSHTPAYGFYVRNAGPVVFEGVRIGRLKDDVRPWLAQDNAKVETIRCVDLGKIAPAPLPPLPK